MSDVTVLIPLGLKHLDLVGRAVESAQAQTYPVHVLIANNSGQPLHMDGATVIDVECKEGMTGAQKAAYSRNVALRQITTPYTLFLDADDTLTCPAAELLTERIKKGDVDYVYGDWYGVRRDRTEYHKSYEFNRKVLLDKNLHAVTALVQTGQALRIGGFDESLPYWEDWGFWVRMAAEGFTGARVPYATFSYFLDDGENRNNGHKVARDIYLMVREQYADRFKELDGMGCCGNGGSKAATTNTSTFRSTNGGSSVLVEYLGRNQGNLTYRHPKSHRRYSAGNSDGGRFVDMHPDDVPYFEQTGMFRAVKAPSVPDTPYKAETEVKTAAVKKSPPNGVTETEADSAFAVLPQGDAGAFHVPEEHSQAESTKKPTRKGKTSK